LTRQKAEVTKSDKLVIPEWYSRNRE
jgi:hypothetical protein